MYRGETCEDCGFPVAFFVRSYWVAPDDLWNSIVGTEYNPRGDGVVLCPPCFTARADIRAVRVSWLASALDEALQ